MNSIRLMHPSRFPTLLAIGLLTLGLAGRALAVTNYWGSSSSGDFTNTANWVGGTVPGGGDAAFFTNAGVSSALQVSSVQTNRDALALGRNGGLVVGVDPSAAWVVTNLLQVGLSAATSFSSMALTGGTVSAKSVAVGNGNGGAHSNTLVVAGPTAVLSNLAGGYVALGNSGNINGDNGNQLVVTNGGRVFYSTGALIVGNGGSRNNLLLVSGSNSVVQNVGVVSVTVGLGANGSGNRLVVSEGGRLEGGSSAGIGNVTAVASYANSFSNSVLITGKGSVWTNNGGIALRADRNSLTIEDGGSVVILAGAGNQHLTLQGTNNTMTVRGSNSTLFLANNLYVGGFNGGTTIGTSNTLLASDGARVSVGNQIYLGDGTGSVNRIVVSNGAQLTSVAYSYLGNRPTSSDNGVWVTGPNSLFKSPRMYLGSNGTTLGLGVSVLVDQGAILEANEIYGGYAASGTLSNLGGVYRFTANPVLGTNGSVFFLQDGAVEYLGVGSAVFTSLGNLTKLGTNVLRLATTTNSVLATYSVGTGQAFQELQLSGTNSRWVGTSLFVANGGTLAISNAVGATVGAAVTVSNLSAVRVINSQVTYEKPVVLSGSYFSDPSTNVFLTNLTVTASGSLSGSNGDLFVFQGNFINQSTNQLQFSLSSAAVLFTNNANHLLSVSNSGSLNLGQGFTNFSQVATNFALGQLSIAANNRVTLAGNADSLTNALYVGWLDIQGINTNSYSDVTNGLFLALYLPNINLYYDKYDPRNDWLNANLINDSAAGYNLWGGGLLLPIPEPSPLLAVGCGIAALAFLRRRTRR